MRTIVSQNSGPALLHLLTDWSLGVFVLSPTPGPLPSPYSRISVNRDNTREQVRSLGNGVASAEPLKKGCCAVQCLFSASFSDPKAHRWPCRQSAREGATAFSDRPHTKDEDAQRQARGIECACRSILASTRPVAATTAAEQATEQAPELQKLPAPTGNFWESEGASSRSAQCCPSSARGAGESPASAQRISEYSSSVSGCGLAAIAASHGRGPHSLAGRKPRGPSASPLPVEVPGLLPKEQSSAGPEPLSAPGRSAKPEAAITPRLGGIAQCRCGSEGPRHVMRSKQRMGLRCLSSPGRGSRATPVPAQLSVSAPSEAGASPFSCSCYTQPHQIRITEFAGSVPMCSIGIMDACRLPACFAEAADKMRGERRTVVQSDRNVSGRPNRPLIPADSGCNKGGHAMLRGFPQPQPSPALTHYHRDEEAQCLCCSQRRLYPGSPGAECALLCSFRLPLAQGGARCAPARGDPCKAYCCLQPQSDALVHGNPVQEQYGQKELNVKRPEQPCSDVSPEMKKPPSTYLSVARAARPPASRASGFLNTAQQLLIDREPISRPSIPSSASSSSFPSILAETPTSAFHSSKPVDEASSAGGELRSTLRKPATQDVPLSRDSSCQTAVASDGAGEAAEGGALNSNAPGSPQPVAVGPPPRLFPIQAEDTRTRCSLRERVQETTGPWTSQAQSFRLGAQLPRPVSTVQVGALSPTSSQQCLTAPSPPFRLSLEQTIPPVDLKVSCPPSPPTAAVPCPMAQQPKLETPTTPAVLSLTTEVPTVVTDVTSQQAGIRHALPRLPKNVPVGNASKELQDNSVQEAPDSRAILGTSSPRRPCLQVPCENHETSVEGQSGGNVAQGALAHRRTSIEPTGVCQPTATTAEHPVVSRIFPEKATPSAGRSLGSRFLSRLWQAVDFTRLRGKSASSRCRAPSFTDNVTPSVQHGGGRVLLKQAWSLAPPALHHLGGQRALPCSEDSAIPQASTFGFIARQHTDNFSSPQRQQQQSDPSGVCTFPNVQGRRSMLAGKALSQRASPGGRTGHEEPHGISHGGALLFSVSTDHYRLPPTETFSHASSQDRDSPLPLATEDLTHDTLTNKWGRYQQGPLPIRTSVREVLEDARRAVAAASFVLGRPMSTISSAAFSSGRGQDRARVFRVDTSRFPPASPLTTGYPIAPGTPQLDSDAYREGAETPSSFSSCQILDKAEMQQWRELLERNRELQQRSW